MSLATATNSPDPVFQPGQVVGQKYRIDRIIGQGGMAAVWEATNERTGKKVALKVILQSLASQHEAEHLFHFEALATSRVNHPNVVTVFDVIEHQDMACIVMELLEGEAFGTYLLRKGPLSVEEALAILLPAMRGVAAAHAEGIIHRDIKPQNIFLCMGPDRRVLTTKVLDFGVALMKEQARDGGTGRPEMTAGTPVYMSPEHLADGQRVDGRTDVYGFGILIYEALTGDAPFVGEVGTPLFERIIHEPPPPIALKRPDLPAGVVHVIHKALAKNPEERFHTLDAMIDALEDELMRRPGLPRSLTPLTGIAMIDSVRRTSGSSPAIQLPMPPENSSGQHETQMLFGLSLTPATDSAPVPVPAAAPPQEGPSTVVLVNPLQRVVPTLKRLCASSRPRIAISAAIVLVLGLSLWLALGSGGRTQAALPSSVPSTTRPVTNPAPAPAPTTVLPAPAPAPTIALPAPAPEAAPAAKEAAAEAVPTVLPRAEARVEDRATPAAARGPRASEPPAHTRRKVDWDPFTAPAGSPTPPAQRPAAIKAPDKAASTRATPPSAAAAKPAAPRAGRLSADDF